jgi:hypothetical protein
MERCVKRVMRQGHDKSAAVAICYSSVAGRLERRAKRLKQLTTKEPNYGARAGETIAGNLGRGGDGKFTRADGSAASGRDVISALTARPKKSSGKRAGASAADQAAAFEKAGVGSDAQALRDFAGGTVPSGDAADRLVKAGLAERGKDGTLRMTGAGRGVVRAAKRGDAQAAADAASRGRDAVAKRDERAQAKVGREQARDQARQAREAERARRRADTERRRGESQSQRSAADMQRVGDRVEEIEALVDSDENVTEFERTRNVNRLDDLARRLERAGGNADLSRRIDAARRKLTSGTAPAAAPSAIVAQAERRESLHVFKATDGWRWIGVSSSAYEDREREIVSTKALEADADRMDTEGAYGPLRWWHVGGVTYTTPLAWETATATPGADIGTCDFSMVVGRMAVEGGTLHPAIGPALATKAGEFQMSRGFSHPISEPDAEGVYHHIRTFERSLLPRGKAANPFTSIDVSKEQNMATMQEKMKALADKFFGGDMAQAEQVVADVTAKDKEVAASGVAFKGEGDAPAAEAAPAIEAVKDAAAEAVTPAAAVEAKAEETKAEVEIEAEADGEDMTFVGDMTIDELVGALAPALAQAMASAMAPVTAELDAAKKELTALRGVATKEAGALVAIDARVKELEGDAPGQRAGYRASQDASNAKTKEQVGVAAPQTEDELAKLVGFMLKG